MNRILITESASYKIDQLLEEADFFNKFQDKFQDIFDKLDKKLSTKGELERLVQKEKSAKKRREDYLKKNNIDISQFKKDLRAGKDVKISFKQTMKEVVAELKETHPIDMVKMLAILTAIVLFQNYLIDILVGDSKVLDWVLGTVIIAPIMEELFKRLSVRKKTTLGGLLAFNTDESGFAYSGDSWFEDRPMAILMHTITTLIHAKGNIRDEYRKDFNIKQADKNKYKNKASKLSTMIHALFNFTTAFI